MKVTVANGLMYRGDATRENMMDCPEADAIAQANGWMYAERITEEFDGKVLHINDETKKIETIEEDFL